MAINDPVTLLDEVDFGSLTDNAGNVWTLSPTVANQYGGHAVLLNGKQVGWAAEIVLGSNGNVYAVNMGGGWYQISASGIYTTLSSDPNTISPDGSVLTYGNGVSLVTSSGVWNFSPQTNQYGAHSLLLDGKLVSCGVKLQIGAGGGLYDENAFGRWYEWSGRAFVPSSAPPTGSSSSGGSPASVSALLGGGYNLTVNFTFHNANGSTTTGSASAAALLQNGNVVTWAQTANADEYDVQTTVDGGKLKVEFYIAAYANGTVATDVEFDNGWMFDGGKSNLDYDVSIVQGGQTVHSASNVQQYLYSTWHYVVGAPEAAPVTLTALEAAGAVPNYDPLLGVSPATISADYAALDAGNTAPVTGTALLDTYMPDVGGRDDIGPQTAWTAEWLMSGNAQAYAVMMATANAAGGVPWHFTDESTGEPVSVQSYADFWEDPRSDLVPANGFPGAAADPWTPEAAHQPDLAYVAYLATGDHYYLNELQQQANFALASAAPPWGNQWLIDGQYSAGFVLDGANEIRAEAWDLREVAEAASATPDSDPLKAYFATNLDLNMQALVQQYLVDNIDRKYGAIKGFIGFNPGTVQVAPWQEGYMVTALAAVAGMGLGVASTQAVQMLDYMEPFIAGFYTNGGNGFNPLNGPAYWLNVADPTSGAPYTTWAQFYSANVAAGTMPANPTTFAPVNFPTDTQGGYPEIAGAALADLITYTRSPQAYQAYGYVMTQIDQAFAAQGSGMLAGYQADPDWAIVPKLSDGTLLSMTQFHIDTSAASNVTLSGGAQDALLSVYGSGTDTLNGGEGKVDLMYGGSGADTFNPGAGNDYVFGGGGSNTFHDNTGNDYYQAAGTGNVFWFGDNHSGHDTIADFTPSRDTLKIAANLNGNGITAASQLLAGATVSNGNTVLHLSPQDDITLLNLNNPASLAPSLFIA